MAGTRRHKHMVNRRITDLRLSGSHQLWLAFFPLFSLHNLDSQLSADNKLKPAGQDILDEAIVPLSCVPSSSLSCLSALPSRTWKHSQYFLMHWERRQLHPVLCRGMPEAAGTCACACAWVRACTSLPATAAVTAARGGGGGSRALAAAGAAALHGGGAARGSGDS